jgi:3-dehydroquinate dehydratase-2
VTHILVLNGPNLGTLGTREPEIYGSETLDDLREILEADASQLGVTVEVRQTDHEGEMLAWLHAAARDKTPVALNPAAWTHYSIALRDAVQYVTTSGVKVIELHISNPHAREEFRHHSVVTGVATGVIAGFGFDSYRLAVAQLAR